MLEHRGARPRIDPSAWVAPNATICGDVTIGPHCRVLFGAVIVAEGGPVELGPHCIVMENAVLRGSARHPLRIGGHVLIGPGAHLSGCTVGQHVFIATNAAIFNGARLEDRSTVRIGGVVHISTVLPADAVVPIHGVAIGQPAEILGPDQAARIDEWLRKLDFAGTVFGLDAGAGRGSVMERLTERYAKGLGGHGQDRPVE